MTFVFQGLADRSSASQKYCIYQVDRDVAAAVPNQTTERQMTCTSAEELQTQHSTAHTITGGQAGLADPSVVRILD